MTKPERVERRFGEGDAEVGVYMSSEMRTTVPYTADTAGFSVRDHVISSRRLVNTARRRPRPRKAVALVNAQQQQQPDRDEHLSSTPLPAWRRALDRPCRRRRSHSRHSANRHRQTRRRGTRCAFADWLPLTNFARWLVQRTTTAVSVDCMAVVTVSRRASLTKSCQNSRRPG